MARLTPERAVTALLLAASAIALGYFLLSFDSYDRQRMPVELETRR